MTRIWLAAKIHKTFAHRALFCGCRYPQSAQSELQSSSFSRDQPANRGYGFNRKNKSPVGSVMVTLFVPPLLSTVPPKLIQFDVARLLLAWSVKLPVFGQETVTV